MLGLGDRGADQADPPPGPSRSGLQRWSELRSYRDNQAAYGEASMHRPPNHLLSKRLFRSSAPFSHIVIAGGLGHVSGIIGQRRDTGALVAPETRAQSQAMFDNLETVLDEARFSLGSLIATRLYLVDYADFETVNGIYRDRLSAPFPARTTLQVVALPLGARVQIDAVIDASAEQE